jgi:hypothetical protein
LLYTQENFLPNDNRIGWDGTYKDKAMTPGVYVYFAEVEYVDGEVEVLKGDLTLIR